MQIRSAALTDPGKVRRRNEDRFVCDDALRLYGVADGIGGLPCGDKAADLAITTLRDAIAASPEGPPPDLVWLTRRVNDAVCSLSARISPHGAGTTLTYAIIRENHFHLAHIGDSRCYRLRGGKLLALTMDHTVENDALRRRAAGEFVLFDESKSEYLARCIGQQMDPDVDTFAGALRPGDRYLFCSDGISKPLGESELHAALANDREPGEILTSLIALANAKGGSDNATGVVVLAE